MRTLLFGILLAAGPASAGVIPPAAVSLSSAPRTRSSIGLSWTAPGDDGNAGQAAAYDLRFTPIGPIDTLAKFLAAVPAAGLPAPGAAGAQESYVLTGLASDTTYYLALRTSDEVPNWSPVSDSLQAKTLAAVPQEAVAGLRGSAIGADFALQWSAVIRNEDGTPVEDDFSRYTVWRTTDLSRAFTPVATVSTGTLAYTHAGGLSEAAYYRVSANDVRGSTSGFYMTLANGADARLLFFSDDAQARIEVPAQAQAPLFAASNGFGSDLRMDWTRNTVEEIGKVLLSYELRALKLTDGQAVPVTLPHPGADLVFTAPGGAPFGELAVFQFNGVEYTKLGGAVGAIPEFRVGVTQTGLYRLQQSLRSQSFTVTQLVPRKVFTPNGDGINDTIVIHFDNPASEVVSGDVFDLTGSHVAELKRGPTSDSLMWDGKDGSGGWAQTGVYLYQLRGAGASANGTVVLVR